MVVDLSLFFLLSTLTDERSLQNKKESETDAERISRSGRRIKPKRFADEEGVANDGDSQSGRLQVGPPILRQCDCPKKKTPFTNCFSFLYLLLIHLM